MIQTNLRYVLRLEQSFACHHFTWNKGARAPLWSCQFNSSISPPWLSIRCSIKMTFTVLKEPVSQSTVNLSKTLLDDCYRLKLIRLWFDGLERLALVRWIFDTLREIGQLYDPGNNISLISLPASEVWASSLIIINLWDWEPDRFVGLAM